jgi:hypothetical protein
LQNNTKETELKIFKTQLSNLTEIPNKKILLGKEN